MIFQCLKSLAVAFSIYSKIPVPRFNWASDDMKYHLCFFPWVGAVIGAVEWGWYNLYFKILAAKIIPASGTLFFSLIALVIPVLISGGFHIDGFLDTMDALHSYGDRAKKLEILKDPHIGAFAVISFSVYLMFSLAFLTLVNESFEKIIICLCFTFFLSRCLSGLSVLIFPKAKTEGMLVVEGKTDKSVFVIVILCLQFIMASCGMFYLSGFKALISLALILLCFWYYYMMSKVHFGGITGDLAGFFVCIAEFVPLLLLIIKFI